jgi:competence transcription factor ComK
LGERKFATGDKHSKVNGGVISTDSATSGCKFFLKSVIIDRAANFKNVAYLLRRDIEFDTAVEVIVVRARNAMFNIFIDKKVLSKETFSFPECVTVTNIGNKCRLSKEFDASGEVMFRSRVVPVRNGIFHLKNREKKID